MSVLPLVTTALETSQISSVAMQLYLRMAFNEIIIVDNEIINVCENCYTEFNNNGRNKC